LPLWLRRLTTLATAIITTATVTTIIIIAGNSGSDADGGAFETIPTSHAVVTAPLRFIANFLDEPGVINDTRAEEVLPDAIRAPISSKSRRCRPKGSMTEIVKNRRGALWKLPKNQRVARRIASKGYQE